MKLATYNIWNSIKGMPHRKKQIVDEITILSPDIICLQEVMDEEFHYELATVCNYKYRFFNKHINEEEGLSIFSRYPIVDEKKLPSSIEAIIKYNDILLSVTNVHLSWKSALLREKDIVNVVNNCDNKKSDYSFIVGDFNCCEDSSVHRFLLGQQSLIQDEANPYWYDLASSYSKTKNELTEATLDFKNNPRWKGENCIETNQRFDRILLKNTYPNKLPIINSCNIFGKRISNKSGYCASDHYGVVIDIGFSG